MRTWAETIAKIDSEFAPFRHRKSASVQPRHTSGGTATLDLASVSSPKSDQSEARLPSQGRLLNMTEAKFVASGLIVTIRTPHGTLYLIASHHLVDQLPEGSIWVTGQEILELERLGPQVKLTPAGYYQMSKTKCLLKAQLLGASNGGLVLKSPFHLHPIKLLLEAPAKRPLPKADEPTMMTVAEAELLTGLADDKIGQILQVVRLFGHLAERHSN